MAILKLINLGVTSAVHAAGAIAGSAVKTATTGLTAADALVRGDLDKAGRVTENYIAGVGRSIEGVLNAAGQLGQQAQACCTDRSQPFLTAETEQSIINRARI